MQPRIATPADCAGIASLVREYWAFEDIAGFEAAGVALLLKGFLAKPECGVCFVAGSQAAPQGYLLAVYLFSLEHGGTMAEIDELFVLPAARSSGLGAQLLQSATSHMAERGIVRIQLQLGRANERARLFYARHGFVPRTGYELMDKPVWPASRGV
jgi:GNAT superfamily N-acetyltransferase